LLLLLLPSVGLAAGDPAKPHILLVVADDLAARDLGLYGGPVPTPNLDELAASGVHFRTAWATPICLSSRVMLLTGQYAHRTGYYGNRCRPRKQAGRTERRFVTLPRLLQQNGYATSVCGKWQLTSPPPDYGFDHSFLWASRVDVGGPREPDGRASKFWQPGLQKDGQPVATGATDFSSELFLKYALQQISEADAAGRPAFVFYSMVLTHAHHGARGSESRWPLTPLERHSIDDPRTLPQSRSSFAASIRYMDDVIGRLVEAMDREGLLSSTLVIFTADNPSIHYGKGLVGLVQDRGAQVPLVMSGPRVGRRAAPDRSLVSLVDLYPTLASYLSIDMPSGQPPGGRPIAALFPDEGLAERDHLVSYMGVFRMVRDADHVLDGVDRLWQDVDGELVEMTPSPEAEAIRTRLQAIKERYPIPRPESPEYQMFEPVLVRQHATIERLRSAPVSELPRSKAFDQTPPR
jgi:arylsulfatase A-like enzyme